ITLKETVLPINATNKAVTWDSGNKAVATVDNGVVTAVAAGQATITVKTADGNFTETCRITVQQPATDPVVDAKISYAYAGNECAAFEWGDSDAAAAEVEYKLSTASSYTKLSGDDKKYLIRQTNTDTARVDLVGLKGGAVYDFKITASTGEVLTAEDVAVSAYDRSGYAHFGKSDGVGAYKDDGTAKSGAKIIYLTEETKNNVDGKGNSIAQYLQNSANNSAPIIIRVVGTVGSATWDLIDYGDEYGKASDGKTPLTANILSGLTPRIDGKSGSLATSGEVTYYQDSSSYNAGSNTLDGIYNTLNLHPTRADGFYDDKECAAIKGLNSYMKIKSGEYDSCWNDCRVDNVKNVTIEGIGED
ncbi:MAG: Ig-like domain-containing protein, partial [Clostridia bacterium]|nr:Ig-like domain-containing protein [Clostridia bacterium]